jgi:hypothetical protein
MAFNQTKKSARKPVSPPVAKYRDGLINVSVWQNVSEKGTFYSVSHERRYQDDKKNWRSSQTYPAFEIQTLRKLLDLAHTDILNAQAEARASVKPVAGLEPEVETVEDVEALATDTEQESS